MAKTNSVDTKRRDAAMTDATGQLEAIFGMMLVCSASELGEIPEWPNFDPASLPHVCRALAIRGRELNTALMSAISNEIAIEDLERLVTDG